MRALGAEMLDAPVSGSVPHAAEGTLAIMVGGDWETFGQVEPILRELGTTVTRIGDNGSAPADEAGREHQPRGADARVQRGRAARRARRRSIPRWPSPSSRRAPSARRCSRAAARCVLDLPDAGMVRCRPDAQGSAAGTGVRERGSTFHYRRPQSPTCCSRPHTRWGTTSGISPPSTRCSRRWTENERGRRSRAAAARPGRAARPRGRRSWKRRPRCSWRRGSGR